MSDFIAKDKVTMRRWLENRGWVQVRSDYENGKNMRNVYQRKGSDPMSLNDAVRFQNDLALGRYKWKTCPGCRQAKWIDETARYCDLPACHTKSIPPLLRSRQLFHVRGTEKDRQLMESIARQKGYSTVSGYVSSVLRELHPELESLR